MKKYFISYFLDSYDNERPFRVGNTIIERKKPIRTAEEVLEVEEKIRAEKGVRKTKIIGWQKVK